MFYRWLNLGASPFSHLFNIEIFILQLNFKIWTSYKAFTGRDDVRGRELPRPWLGWDGSFWKILGRPRTSMASLRPAKACNRPPASYNVVFGGQRPWAPYESEKMPSSDAFFTVLFMVWEVLVLGRRPILLSPCIKFKFLNCKIKVSIWNK